MSLRHKERAAPEKRTAQSTAKGSNEQDIATGRFDSILPGNPRSDRESLALFDAAIYRAVAAKQREVVAFLAGGHRA